MTNELYTFVKEALEKGQSRGDIQRVLGEAGWQEEEVQKALAAFAEVSFAVPVPKPKPYLQAREAFLFLISFIALYISAFSFGILVFAFIDKFMPDPLSYGEFFPRGLTTALASLIIAFPLYLFMMWRLATAATKDPERRQSKVGKWLTYITLVVAAGIIIGDLIAVLSGLLGGELTGRFMLKALTILAITGSIFGYYLWSLQKEEKEKDEKGKRAATQEKPMWAKGFTGVVVAAVVLAVIYGLFQVGTPAQQRLLQFDERRVGDLESITYAIDSYWDRNQALPDALEQLHDSRYYYVQSVVDPKTGDPYEYRALDADSYELCATFETDSKAQESPSFARPPFSLENWQHGVGRACFAFDVRKPLPAGTLPVESVPVPAQQ